MRMAVPALSMTKASSSAKSRTERQACTTSRSKSSGYALGLTVIVPSPSGSCCKALVSSVLMGIRCLGFPLYGKAFKGARRTVHDERKTGPIVCGRMVGEGFFVRLCCRVYIGDARVTFLQLDTRANNCKRV